MESQKIPAINFIPEEVGEAEYSWWRAHNDKDYPKVIEFLTLQLSKQYNLSLDKAKKAIGPFMGAVKYHDQGNWKGAIEALTGVYRIIRENTRLPFNSEVVAEKEVNWWRLHDELEEQKDKSPLTRAFMDLYSEIYGIDPELLRDAAEQRTLATVEHDKAEQERSSQNEVDKHWKKAEEHLVAFYTQLKQTIAKVI